MLVELNSKLAVNIGLDYVNGDATVVVTDESL